MISGGNAWYIPTGPYEIGNSLSYFREVSIAISSLKLGSSIQSGNTQIVATELAVFLEIARTHRMRAEEVRDLGRDSTDAQARRHFETLAAKLETQASCLEAHAVRLQSLIERSDQLAAELQSEIERARVTVAQIKKALLPD